MLNAIIKYSYLAILLSVFFSYSSCKTSGKRATPDAKSKANTPKKQPAEEKEVKQEKFPYQPAETHFMDLIHTQLDVSFDWQKQYLNGTAHLMLKPWFYDQDSLILDAKGMDIRKVVLTNSLIRGNSNEEKPLPYKYDGKTIRVKLDRSYKRTDTFMVEIDYVAKPNELPKGGSAAITSDIGLYFINPLGTDPDKPRQIWTQGETEASSCWFPTLDVPNEKTTQEMFITVDSSMSVLSNGSLISVQDNKNGTKTWNWEQNLPHAPYLFMMAIGKYAVVKDKWKNLEVNYYVEPDYAPYAKSIFGATPEMLEFFSSKLKYPYPWDKYSQIVVRDYVSGAMENTSATIFMEALQQDDRALMDDHWESIIAHELFHHWFGDLVTCESWSNLPLNESFANYSEYLWAEYKHGVDEADYHGENEADEYYEEAKRKQVPLIRFHYKDKEDMFDRHSYNKGGRILHMLRNYTGDEAFFEALALYLKKNQFQPAEVHNLRIAFEEVTGEDLNWFFNQWFLASGHPILSVTHSYAGGTLMLKVKQEQDTTKSPVYKLPVKVDVWTNGIKTTQSIIVDQKEQTFYFAAFAQPNLVVFDSDFQLLGKIIHEKSLEEWAFQFENYDRYLGRKQALDAFLIPIRDEKVVNLANDSQVVNIMQKALQDPFWAIRMTALNQFAVFSFIQNETLLKSVEKLALSDPKSKVRARAISTLSSYDNKAYISYYIQAMKEKPYSVYGAGLSGYLKSGDSSIAINLNEIEKMENINVVLPLAEYYVTSGTKGKTGWFKEKLSKSSPRIVYNIIDFFHQYVKNVESERISEAREILKQIADGHKYEVIRMEAKMALEDLEDSAGK